MLWDGVYAHRALLMALCVVAMGAAVAADLPDLRIPDGGLALTTTDPSLPAFWESAADRQCVVVTVHNASAATPAPGVTVQLSGGPDLLGVSDLGPAVLAGDVPPGQSRSVAIAWDLGVEPIRDFQLYAHATCAGMPDPTPDDNWAHAEVAISYAHNGQRAFSVFDDTYRFASPALDESALAALRDQLVDFAIGCVNADEPELALLAGALGPVLEARTRAWLAAACQSPGMVTTADAYFQDPTEKPVAASVPQMTPDDLLLDLQTCPDTQLLPLTQALLTAGGAVPADWGVTDTLATARDLLAGDRRCPVLYLASRQPTQEMAGAQRESRRAILAYKLIEVTGRDPVLYIYDPGHPVGAGPGDLGIMPQITLKSDGWSWAGGMDYGTPHPRGISARAPHLPASVDDYAACRRAIRDGLADIAQSLHTAHAFAALLTCPADALFVDALGQRVGMVDGRVVNDVPGAEVVTAGEAEWYTLPRDSQYQLTITGTASGEATLTLLNPPTPDLLGVTSFNTLPVTPGGRLSVPVISGGDAQAALTPGGLAAPTISGTLDLAAPWWSTAAIPTETGPDTLPPPADLPAEMMPVPLALGSVIDRAVVCLDQDERGQLVGEGNAFGFGVAKVAMYLHIKDALPGTELTLDWMHEGDLLRKQVIAADGTGGTITYLMAANKPQLWEGNYAVIVRENGRHVGTFTFTVR